jgi:hypothetical protein
MLKGSDIDNKNDDIKPSHPHQIEYYLNQLTGVIPLPHAFQYDPLLVVADWHKRTRV